MNLILPAIYDTIGLSNRTGPIAFYKCSARGEKHDEPIPPRIEEEAVRIKYRYFAVFTEVGLLSAGMDICSIEVEYGNIRNSYR